MSEERRKVAEKENKALSAQVLNLRKGWEQSDENRKEADKRVDELHTGDAVGNALDVLQKH